VTEPPQPTVFHVEVRQFPHLARAFNLSREDLERRIVAPWASGRPMTLDERSFSPERARLRIYEGPPLDSAAMGLGRGWASATRGGRDVTPQVLEQAQRRAPGAMAGAALESLKAQVLERCAARSLAIHDVPELAGELLPGALVSERLALAERVVWELLHQGRVRLLTAADDRRPVDADTWRATLLAWETWATRCVSIEAVAAQPA